MLFHREGVWEHTNRHSSSHRSHYRSLIHVVHLLQCALCIVECEYRTTGQPHTRGLRSSNLVEWVHNTNILLAVHIWASVNHKQSRVKWIEWSTPTSLHSFHCLVSNPLCLCTALASCFSLSLPLQKSVVIEMFGHTKYGYCFSGTPL